jgi:hypothetical protein
MCAVVGSDYGQILTYNLPHIPSPDISVAEHSPQFVSIITLNQYHSGNWEVLWHILHDTIILISRTRLVGCFVARLLSTGSTPPPSRQLNSTTKGGFRCVRVEKDTGKCSWPSAKEPTFIAKAEGCINVTNTKMKFSLRFIPVLPCN